MGQLNEIVSRYLQDNQTDITNELLPQTLNELNIKFSEKDLIHHYEMLRSLLDRVSESLLTSKEATVENETGYDISNYFFDKGVLLKHTINVLCVFRLSLLKHLRQSDLFEDSQIHEGFLILEEIMFAFDVAIRTTTQNFNDKAQKNKEVMEYEYDEISAPVVVIDKSRAVLPLIGNFTPRRLQNLIENTLDQVSSKSVNTIIVDFSGIATFDTFVAKHLFDLIDSLKLIGTKTIITGVHPSMALTAVHLGVDLSKIESYGQLRQFLSKNSKPMYK
ncbi:STAS domain-containing protein [Jeotgalibacillus soli]|uniref:STAS domain-containing protein n=1 Tax=Jeotgalibacillus soli TaxID=889306 RepID=A0A0C2VMW9_9BACL|nr:STAS domain-containing protein [Jeotgalibacillus soli]KIL45796.1 hypothetical protein KP78_21450 [Jeotgalibacillus soli]